MQNAIVGSGRKAPTTPKITNGHSEIMFSGSASWVSPAASTPKRLPTKGTTVSARFSSTSISGIVKTEIKNKNRFLIRLSRLNVFQLKKIIFLLVFFSKMSAKNPVSWEVTMSDGKIVEWTVDHCDNGCPEPLNLCRPPGCECVVFHNRECLDEFVGAVQEKAVREYKESVTALEKLPRDLFEKDCDWCNIRPKGSENVLFCSKTCLQEFLDNYPEGTSPLLSRKRDNVDISTE